MTSAGRSVEAGHHHRNGVDGTPFFVVQFRDDDGGAMIGVMFPEPGHVAVFARDNLVAGNAAFGSNSWRGDVYEPFLRHAIARHTGGSPPEAPPPACPHPPACHRPVRTTLPADVFAQAFLRVPPAGYDGVLRTVGCAACGQVIARSVRGRDGVLDLPPDLFPE